jgi:2-oxoisovalerate dehydrogenase E1 component beta subunit
VRPLGRNLFTAVNDAMAVAMEADPRAIILGQDVAFGGVFRCTTGLRERFGAARVFNSPLNEASIVGFSIGYASLGRPVIAEIQFADYIFPAFDQLVNEAAKFRYRSGNQYDCGGLTVRAPYGARPRARARPPPAPPLLPCVRPPQKLRPAPSHSRTHTHTHAHTQTRARPHPLPGAVGHGGHYHSQSPEAYFAHTPGLKVVMPRSPAQAKGLLLSCVADPNPCLFFEPKALYRASVEDVPLGDFRIPLGVAEVVRQGSDVTLVGWGAQVNVLLRAAEEAAKQAGVSCEVVDLRTVVPWDEAAVVASVKRTGRCIVAHEAPLTSGFGAEVAAVVQQKCFLHLEAPVARVTGWDTPFSLVHEYAYLPDANRVLEQIKKTLHY